MKPPFYITYWDNNKDKAMKVGIKTYDEVIIKQTRLVRKGHNNVQIHVR